MKLNLGCGPQVTEGWVNVDYALGARLMKIPLFRIINKKVKLFKLDWNDKIYIHDLTKKFPWNDSTIDVIYSSHTLEHLSKNQGQRFLAECYRVLRKDGVIRIVVPDLRQVLNEYNEGLIKAEDFVEVLGVLYGESDNKLKTKLLPFLQFPHKCMYDTPRLIKILNEIGFHSSSRSAFESDINDISLVELESRTKSAVIVEGRKG